ncbi:MAG: hypothetical protein GDA56_01005 [Hormoscilla sp. GM7CHS1pb]|nr:hypothetical protein [Hormoscilla sp. GM7CHS1pb]
MVVLEVINETTEYVERMEEEGDRGKVARGGSEIPLAWCEAVLRWFQRVLYSHRARVIGFLTVL